MCSKTEGQDGKKEKKERGREVVSIHVYTRRDERGKGEKERSSSRGKKKTKTMKMKIRMRERVVRLTVKG